MDGIEARKRYSDGITLWNDAMKSAVYKLAHDCIGVRNPSTQNLFVHSLSLKTLIPEQTLPLPPKHLWKQLG